MSTAPADQSTISSPLSTGSAGTFFEQHVDASLLSLLLVGGIPPVLTDSRVVEVHLQTEHLGWNTDDFLLVAETGAGVRRKLAGQVKRKIVISFANEEGRKAIGDYWRDFRDNPNFDAAVDRFALVVLRGSHNLLEYFNGLLDCARAAPDAADFGRRLSTRGFVHSVVLGYWEEIRKIVDEIEGRSVTSAELWPFLKTLHLVSLDLNTATAQAEAQFKSLLALASSEPDAAGAANQTWAELLDEVGGGMPAAKSYTRAALPGSVLSRHSQVPDAEHRIVQTLRGHSRFVLSAARTTIGSEVHLSRERLVQAVVEQLDISQVVIVAGPAGSGKSGVAKKVAELLAADHFTFAFRASEFAVPHLDEVLRNAQIPGNAAALQALMAGQARKILIVESVERLLEASVRDAFADLLTILRSDPGWQLVVTCRDYSADLVRSSLLELAGIPHSLVPIPPLDDDELASVQSAYPFIERLLLNGALRPLLRSPYLLDKAVQMAWPPERPLPDSERAFRDRFWRDVVRDEAHPGQGMPRRRDETFGAVALRRARALTPFASSAELDAEAVEALHHDSLIVFSEHSDALAGPAHDVLEDWALLRWVEQQYAEFGGSLSDLSRAVGAFPAVRRTLRAWLRELATRDPEEADRVFDAVIRDATLPRHFRDDVIVALMQSPSADELLRRHAAALFAEQGMLLHRVLHLLRVGCVTAPDWFGATPELASTYQVPDGPAWEAVVALVADRVADFDESEHLLLLGLIEDWSKGVTSRTPYPSGADAAARIAFHLLDHLDDFQSGGERDRALRLVAKIPDAARDRFVELLLESPDEDGWDRTGAELRKILFSTLDGSAACRDLPDEVITAAERYFLLTEEDLVREQMWRSSLELEPLFGIREELSHDFFPPSAYRGPFLPLLRHHFRKGLDFVVALLNRSADWYARPRVPDEHVEPPSEIELLLPGGHRRRQWCNARLWNMYRGISVGPYALQSALMALEQFLLETAQGVESIDGVLIHILSVSESAAVTAVVASVAVAHPHAAPETLLALLSCPECVLLDRARLVQETSAPSHVAAMFPRLNPSRRIYDDERKASDQLSHRRTDIETAILNLQLGTSAARVRSELARLRSAVPSVEQRSQMDRVWSLSLHRMDLGRYTASPRSGTQPNDVQPEEQDGVEGTQVFIEPTPAEPDVQAMADESSARYAAAGARIGLLMWGIKVFDREHSGGYDPAEWGSRLSEARAASQAADTDGDAFGKDGRGIVAAVCVRDHWEEMTEEQREWCVDSVCSAIEAEADDWDYTARIQKNRMRADRPAAAVVSSLFRRALAPDLRDRVATALCLALTHPVDEVRGYASHGVGRNIAVGDAALALRYVSMLATEAALIQRELAQLERHTREARVDIPRRAASAARSQCAAGHAFHDDAILAYDPRDWVGAHANIHIFSILNQTPSSPVAVAAHARLANVLVGWWNTDRRSGRERPIEAEPQLTQMLASFVLKCDPADAVSILTPIVAAVDDHPREVSFLLLGLVEVEDGLPNTPQFWTVWRLFADRVAAASWLSGIDREHSEGRQLLSAVFFALPWKEGVRHWRSLEGYDGNVNSLFERLPNSSAVLESYLRFLYHVGERSLPRAFIGVSARLRQGDLRRLLESENTRYLLESLLRRYVYGTPRELKRHADLRDAVLHLLDALVELGSSAAYRMRDDFVTPLGPIDR